MRRFKATVFGRVQGVGFRVFVLRQAQNLGLTGTVRNLYFPKRQVEVIAEGPESDLKQLLALLHEGPFGARVDGVETLWGAASGNFANFSIS